MHSKIITLLILLVFAPKVFSQKIRVIQAKTAKVDIRVDNDLRKGTWNIVPEARPDIFDVYTPGKAVETTFITDQDSISFSVKPGDYYQFVVLLNGMDSAFTAIRGNLEVPRAKFSDAYQRKHRGKTKVEIPAVYELVNIVFAITSEGQKNNGLIQRDLDYYHEVMKWFTPFAGEPVVKRLNEELMHGNYHGLKMDAYSFDLTGEKITPSDVYDRLGLDPVNHLLPYIEELEALAKRSHFADFYHKHQSFYQELIQGYEPIGVAEMQRWLGVNFPSTRYDCFKIVFSPLVNANQSATWFLHDGFAEAQAHVNFPSRRSSDYEVMSKAAVDARAGDIVFTELNHAFIGPESVKFADKINQAFTDMSVWNDFDSPAKHYDSPMTSFDEYMNWGLVNLRYVDLVPGEEQEKLIANIEQVMKNRRGFKKFPEFSQFLVAQYRSRKSGQTVADLYPAIVEWFVQNK
ncbi:DUF4932 domain-containing protein [Dyadobacter crusticola]|uniref:DUF4932 domain-containing protein n=1 Tax=Dyadobacter crusticola TaxID=292407 RepID=UPI0004E11DB9|nr:DUF4932 domain-containing protein [Dyadobacter crusticola]